MFFKRKIKEKFKNLIKKYKKQNKNQRNNFICLLNHDIKTPILAHIQTLELILKGSFEKINPIQKELLEEILNSNYFILEVIINTIFILNCENNHYELNMEKINLVDEINNCIGALNSELKSKNQKIILRADKNIKLNADRKMIQKIIYNIILMSMLAGYEKTNIEIRAQENNKKISFSAKNKSTYMTKEKIKSMLNQEKNSLCDFNQLGMSLNLNIAKRLIDAHNWDLIATSKKDNSSTFGFVISK